jgi:hypothetical protein
VKTSSPSTWTSKIPFLPGTISTVGHRGSNSSKIRAARPTAFGLALQGTQYSMRIWGPAATRPA